MRKTTIFYINGHELELPIFKKGDRVEPTDNATTAIGATGTVESTRTGGLFVDVIWDKELYDSKIGGQIEMGKGWMVDGLVLLND